MHSSGSFDYKVIKANIRRLLESRSKLNNTIQVSMPFVKATTTIGGASVPLLDGGIGFTLGLHAIDQDVKYEDIYSSQDSDMPLIGYTYVDGKTRRIYANNPGDQIAARVFDRRADLFTNSEGFIRIPPPGITNFTIGRNKNGLLAHGQLTINIPSLIQLESLQKTFLIPGVGMILEWGQQFAVESLTTDVTAELPDISYAMFPWHDRNATLDILTRLGKNNLGLQEILDKYVYPSQGQYMWMFGRVANFTINTLADGSFQSTVKIVGPSEDSWAYSTKNTAVPAKDPSTKFFCASDTNSVYSYFTDTSTGGLNLKSLLDDVRNGNKLKEWQSHVKYFKQGNLKSGEPAANEKKATTSQNTFADLEDAYFMTWRFFVNVVLNDPMWGIKRIFSTVMEKEMLDKIGMLISYADGPDRKKSVATNKAIDDPLEPFVGYNKFLRSVDPSVMIIVNEEAAKLAEANDQYNSTALVQKFLESSDESDEFKAVGQFDTAASAYNSDPAKKDRSFLSTGVWLNHKTVVESMIGGDTIVRGITNLLDRMNTATLNYWELTLDTIEPVGDKNPSYNYMVIDANVKENSANAVAKFIDEVHVFNKYVRTDAATGELVGSELIECNIDLSLPKRLFSQIATLGLVQPEDLDKVSPPEKTTEQRLAALENPESEPKTAKLADPNDTLRRLFAITVLDPKGENTQGPDLTILPRTQRAAELAANGVCGKANVQTTAQTAGSGNKAAGISTEDSLKGKDSKELATVAEEAQKLLNSKVCKECEQCSQTQTQSSINTTSSPGSKKLSQLTIAEIQSVQRPRGSVLAVGKYQAIPVTFNAWVSAQKISPDTVFDSAAQEKLGDWLIVGKRPKVGRFVNGDPTISLEEAQLELAKEFASIPVPFRVTRPAGAAGRNDPGAVLEAGQSYYFGIAGNRATASSARYQEALRIARQTRSLQSLKEFIAKGEGNYDALNRGTAGDTSTYSTDYYLALTQRPPSAQQTTKTCTDEQYIKLATGTVDPNTTRPRINPSAEDGRKLCAQCERAKQTVKQATQLTAAQEKTKNLVEKSLREFGGLQKLFRYVEVFPEYMIAEITDTADGNFANAFGASPGTLSIGGDLVMPGINGLRVGELFWIDRLPSFYRAFGAFQVLSIEDTIDVSGWKTKIHARFNFLGTKWKSAMAERLNRE